MKIESEELKKTIERQKLPEKDTRDGLGRMFNLALRTALSLIKMEEDLTKIRNGG